MKKDFNDPKTLIDDCTPVPKQTLDLTTALQGKQVTVRELKFGKDFQKLVKPPHFDAIQFLNSTMGVEENRFRIETHLCEHFSCPESARKAFASINQLRHLRIHYRKDNGVDHLSCQRGKPNNKDSDRASANKNVDRVGCKEKNSNGNSKDREEENYITAAKYLPDLLRKNGDILVKSDQQEIFAQFKKTYKTQALWIEDYLLLRPGTPTESGSKPPTERQYRPGKISAKLHELIKDMWAEAIINQNSLCKWILAFDCPSQAWLTLEAILLLEDLEEHTPKNGFQLYKAEQATLKRLREYEGIKVSLLYSDNEDENFLYLKDAFSVTLIQLLESGVELAEYQAYLNAKTGEANAARKGEKGKRSNKGFGTSK
ncbi:hypothetical protein H6F74_26810 [Trichocoleus sp. FACHB-90]|uniref:hypothetical protein n=1 Tax=Cyanophyceae TaxID=3028117 RepID=UPI0016899FA6|nr:hypothetical protein [Trichocoleus sp. FACHB-90]MBD1929818.1 hypothetical protein [Trichocoleus sp. FACHB-90]